MPVGPFLSSYLLLSKVIHWAHGFKIIYTPRSPYISSPDMYSSKVQIYMSDDLLDIASLTHSLLDLWILPPLPQTSKQRKLSFSHPSPSWVNGLHL